MTKSYAPMFVFANGETKGNAQRFATYSEAQESAKHRFNSWTMPTGYTVAETDDPVNYKFSTAPEDYGDVRIGE